MMLEPIRGQAGRGRLFIGVRVGLLILACPLGSWLPSLVPADPIGRPVRRQLVSNRERTVLIEAPRVASTTGTGALVQNRAGLSVGFCP